MLGLAKHMKMHRENYSLLRRRQMEMLKCKSKHKDKYLDPLEFSAFPNRCLC